MTIITKQFDPAATDEEEPFSIDFVNDLPTGELPVTATATVFVKSTSPVQDSNAASIPQSACSISGTVVSVLCTGWVSGCYYGLKIRITTTSGYEIELVGYVNGQDPD